MRLRRRLRHGDEDDGTQHARHSHSTAGLKTLYLEGGQGVCVALSAVPRAKRKETFVIKNENGETYIETHIRITTASDCCPAAGCLLFQAPRALDAVVVV